MQFEPVLSQHTDQQTSEYTAHHSLSLHLGSWSFFKKFNVFLEMRPGGTVINLLDQDARIRSRDPAPLPVVGAGTMVPTTSRPSSPSRSESSRFRFLLVVVAFFALPSAFSEGEADICPVSFFFFGVTLPSFPLCFLPAEAGGEGSKFVECSLGDRPPR